MNRFIHGVVRAFAETFEFADPVLEIGSYQVEGQDEVSDLRSLFPGTEYIGLDVRPGPGVDLVGDVEDLPLPDASVGTVVAVSTFEHVPRFWRGFDEIRRVLRPDGALILSCPFYFHVHNYPADYWRFTPQAFKLLLEDYPQKLIGYQGAPTRPRNVWAVAFREEAVVVTTAQLEACRARLLRYGREPLRWDKRLRYQLAALLVGGGVFRPYLDREQWECEWLSRSPVPSAAARERTV